MRLFHHTALGPHANVIGAFNYPNGYLAEDLGWPSEDVSKALAECVSIGLLARFRDNRHIAVLRHFEWNTIHNANVMKRALSELEALPRDPQITRIVRCLEPFSKRFKEDFTDRLAAIGKRLCEPMDVQSANTVPETATVTALSPARTRAGGEWEEIWKEFCSLPGFDHHDDEAHARRAWENLEDGPSAEVMRECIRRYGSQLAERNARRSSAAGHELVKKPSNWLERERCWVGLMKLGAVA